MATTPQGKAVSARNATTHGLFCRQTVLPHLGESPDAYKALLDALLAELPPRNLMEHQYLELWAEASWKLRRLSRWEAQVWEDDLLDDDQRLAKIERLARLQTALRRQLDKSVRMLQKDVPDLYHGRIRQDILTDLGLSEQECKRDDHASRRVALLVGGEAQYQADEAEGRIEALAQAALDAALDTTQSENCQNELSAQHGAQENCQNEPTAPSSSPAPLRPLAGERAGGVRSSSPAPLPDLRHVQTFTVRGPAPSPAPAFKQFARACAKRE